MLAKTAVLSTYQTFLSVADKTAATYMTTHVRQILHSLRSVC